MENYDVYSDIKARTGGDIYIGVVGPVRSGKSTFIKKFMELLVIPGIEDVHSREQAIDELPQAAAGKMIMTTEPKFIPKEAAVIRINDDCELKVRLIDCVGFMVEGAAGHIENEQERLVKTPWSEDDMPFSQAAEQGTRKVIKDHSTIGIVVTQDGSIGDIGRENYIDGESKAINELKEIGKPFIVLLNSERPYSDHTRSLAAEIAETHGVSVLPVNMDQLRKDDINKIMESILMEFPVTMISLYMPKWVEMLPETHRLKQEMIEKTKYYMNNIDKLNDLKRSIVIPESDFIKEYKTISYSPADGEAKIEIVVDESCYYSVLSELTDLNIEDEYNLIRTLKELAGKKNELVSVGDALNKVNATGYGIVSPAMDEIIIEEPEVIKHGNKYGVKIKAVSPSIHMIKANIETEIAPIVGTKEQADDLIQYINSSDDPDGIWNTNIFGKTIRQLVEDGISGKINKLSEDSRIKLQESMQKIVNENNGGLICIII